MGSRTMTVLLVEDDRLERARFESYIGTQTDVLLLGYAETAADALVMTLTTHPQVIILDLELRGSHGLEFIKALRRHELTPQPAIVVLTAITGKATHKAVQAQGVERVYCKSDDGYIKHGPAYVFDYLREIQPYFSYEVEPPVEQVASEPSAARLERIQLRLAEYGGALGSRNLSYTADAILAISKQPIGPINLRKVLCPGVCDKYGVSYETLIGGMQYCVETLWDRPGEKRLADVFSPGAKAGKGMGELKQVLLYFAGEFRDKSPCS